MGTSATYGPPPPTDASHGREWLRPLAARLSPAAVLWLGLVAVALSLFGVARTSNTTAIAIDEVQQLVATAAAVIALLLAARSAAAPRRFVARGLALACFLAGIGMAIGDLQPGFWSEGAGPGDAFFVASAITLVAVSARAVSGGMERSRVITVALDTTILLIASATALVVLWERVLDPRGQNAQSATGLACALFAIAGPLAVSLALLRRGVQPQLRGAHATLFGVVLVGLSMAGWQTLVAHGLGSVVSPADYGYSIGILVTAYGGAAWDLTPTRTPRFRAFARAAADTFPLLAAALCVCLLILTPGTHQFGSVQLGTGAVVLLVLMRQGLLSNAERRARASERATSARFEREVTARVTVLRSLGSLEAADTPEETARRICVEALKLDGIDVAAIRAFNANGDGVIVGLAGAASDVPYAVGTVLAPERTAHLARNAASGPWTETFAPSDDSAVDALYRAGLRVMSNAPLVWNDQIVGVIGLGAGSGRSLAIDAERLITVREFGVVAGPLLGPPLAERARLDGLHEAVSQVIDRQAFHPVFQPIVDLSSGQTVGYEALTRFDDGVRPDVCFANAAAAGLGASLESACLRAAQRDAIAIPAGAWLSLNVSPALAAAMVPLIAVLEHGERDIVLEITEHAPIADYAGLTAALGGIRRHIRIAVDDAGAGYAGLKHILEIRPDIVKLDIALVRGVDGDPVRRALIAGMGAFARESGCGLLAEGIETPEELATLRALGVPLGQGFLLGRPAAIDDIVTANQLDGRAERRSARRRPKSGASRRAA